MEPERRAGGSGGRLLLPPGHPVTNSRAVEEYRSSASLPPDGETVRCHFSQVLLWIRPGLGLLP